MDIMTKHSVKIKRIEIEKKSEIKCEFYDCKDHNMISV